ncbi:hypothetical protein [Amycolatopsis thermophila]|uniref:Uncharacterized protein n=1 Tax=Amycolatopsis thermophila TaxID=206084 RepID=A0ABU0EZ25_9PSEU|nr:hypothetical protein [Amycolatopsis thermophila]MDQ0380569.1 hypothetical protein [Amycolatopsis thermophila]
MLTDGSRGVRRCAPALAAGLDLGDLAVEHDLAQLDGVLDQAREAALRSAPVQECTSPEGT